jgi:hypothetical protein
MKTAITCVRTAAGWKLAAGPDIAADKQRRDANGMGSNWPDGILEVRFQMSNGVARTWSKEKAQTIVRQFNEAEARVAQKSAGAAEQRAKADAERKAQEEAAAKQHQESEAHQEAMKKKEEAKKEAKKLSGK